jgi:hypothetical protein
MVVEPSGGYNFSSGVCNKSHGSTHPSWAKEPQEPQIFRVELRFSRGVNQSALNWIEMQQLGTEMRLL